MFGWDRDRIFNVEYELLFNNLKWLSCDFTLNDSSEGLIDIFCSRIKSYDPFVVLRYRKRGIGSSFKLFVFFCVPIPALCFHPLLGHGEIFIGYCLIVSEWTEFMWKEFSPLSRRAHMVYNFSTECLIFLSGIGFIENTVFSFFDTDTSKTIFT